VCFRILVVYVMGFVFVMWVNIVVACTLWVESHFLRVILRFRIRFAFRVLCC
jgi:hypothetical protein